MFRKVSNLSLIIIFVVIALIYVSIRVFRHTGRSSSFKAKLVQIDTSDVSKIMVDRKGTHFEVYKDDNGMWKVTLPKLNKTAEATASSVKNSLEGLLSIEPGRIVTRDPSKWSEYQVDTSGTRVRVYEGPKNTLDLIIGKFGVQGRQSFYTYVRLNDDNTVYSADNFMGMSYFSGPDSFRNNRFLQINPDSVRQISFTYPADTSFTLNNPDSVWYLGSRKADSAKVASYLSQLRYMSNSKYVDDINPAALNQPLFTEAIAFKGLKSITINAYQNPKYGLILHSEFNPNNYFSDSTLVKRIFKGKSEFVRK